MLGRRQLLEGSMGGILIVFLLASLVMADEIELIPEKGSRVFKGEITQGIPETITIEAGGVTANIERRRILSLHFETPHRIETTTGHSFQGNITSTLSEIVTIRTGTGEVDIPLPDIQTIRFPHKRITEPPFSHRVFLQDNRNFNGTITSGIPNPVDINENGIVSHIDRDKIREISYGEPDVVRTVENEVYEGEIVSRIPTILTLKTAYGTLDISQDKIALIRFLGDKVDQDKQTTRDPILLILLGAVFLALLWFFVLGRVD